MIVVRCCTHELCGCGQRKRSVLIVVLLAYLHRVLRKSFIEHVHVDFFNDGINQLVVHVVKHGGLPHVAYFLNPFFGGFVNFKKF